jgi:hypothetical protein
MLGAQPLEMLGGTQQGDAAAASADLEATSRTIWAPMFSNLGDHDTIQMVPGLEAAEIRMLLNESEVIVRGDQQIYLAGIDDAHCFKVDNIEKANSPSRCRGAGPRPVPKVLVSTHRRP